MAENRHNIAPQIPHLAGIAHHHGSLSKPDLHKSNPRTSDIGCGPAVTHGRCH